MKVTGYMLREAIKQHELRRDTASQSFNGSLKKFPDEEKPTPQAVVEQFLAAEAAIARLQVSQMRYNLEVKVNVAGEVMTLGEAIKRVGGLGRAEKMWRLAAGPKKDRYGSDYEQDEIDPAKVRSQATLTVNEAVKLAARAGKQAGAMRAAIATANATEIEVSDLSPVHFE